MYKYFALTISVLCLCHSSLALVQNAKMVDARVNHVSKFEAKEVEPCPECNLTMAAFTRSAKQALEPLPFINRDSIASIILLTDGAFGNLTGVLAIVSQALNMAGFILSLMPFGAMLPILVQIVIVVLMAPQTRFFAKYLLYRIWLIFPPSSSDRYYVTFDNNNVIVIPASEAPSSPAVGSTSTLLPPSLPERK